MLEIRNLHARIADDGTEIIRGLNLTVKNGEVAAIMGPNGSGKSTLSYVLAGREDYEVTEGDILYDGESILELDPAERAAKGIFLAFQYPMEISRCRDHGVPQGRDERAAQGARRGAAVDSRFSEAREGCCRRPLDGRGDAEASAECRFLRRREEARRDPADEAPGAKTLRARRDRFRPRHRRAEDRRRGRQRAALARPRHRRHHPLPAAPGIHRAWTACTSSTRARSSSRATRTWRSSWKRMATPASSARRPERGEPHEHPRCTSADPGRSRAGRRLRRAPVAAAGRWRGHGQARQRDRADQGRPADQAHRVLALYGPAPAADLRAVP